MNFLDYVNKPVRLILLRDLQNYAEFIKNQWLKSTSQQRKLAAIKSMMSFATKLGYSFFFIDSDILLAQNYIKEHTIRLTINNDALYFSLKRNIDKGDLIISDEAIAKGLERPNFFDDKRFSRQLLKGDNSIHPIEQTGTYKILNETDNLRYLGNGRKINGIDLATCVVGHSMSIRKSVFESLGGFSSKFKGWGFEDTYFGACAIANGNFVIPVLNTGVYHINHPPRSGSEKKKQEELVSNINIYKNLINQNI